MGWVGAGVWGEHYIATQWCLSLFGLGNEIFSVSAVRLGAVCIRIGSKAHSHTGITHSLLTEVVSCSFM
jgi:hypothetical protein